MNSSHNELTKMTFKVLKFTELSTDDLRGAVSAKVNLLTQKTDTDGEALKRVLKAESEKNNKMVSDQFKTHLQNSM